MPLSQALNDAVATPALSCDDDAIRVVLRVAIAWGMESLKLLKLKYGVYI